MTDSGRGYIVIQRWMISEMKLKGNELLAYALIYGFSQATDTAFTGSLAYIADWLQTDKANAMRTVKGLRAKGLIRREELNVDGVKRYQYVAVTDSYSQNDHSQNDYSQNDYSQNDHSQNDHGRPNVCIDCIDNQDNLYNQDVQDSLNIKYNPEDVYNINNNIYNNTTRTYTSLSKGGVGGNLSLNRAEADDDTPSPATPAPASPAPAPKKPAPVDERFDQFWCVYPRKIGKGAARKAFAKIKPNDELLKRMVVAVVAQSKSDMWTRDRGQYIPNPATWLNQERWEDEVQKPPDPPKPTHGYAERQISEDEFGDDFFVDVMSRPRKGDPPQ